MAEEPKRIGRPRKNPDDARRQNLIFRVGSTMLDRLKSEAADKGLSVSEAVEAIISQHFLSGDMISAVREQIRAEFDAREAAQQAARTAEQLRLRQLAQTYGGLQQQSPQWNAGFVNQCTPQYAQQNYMRAKD